LILFLFLLLGKLPVRCNGIPLLNIIVVAKKSEEGTIKRLRVILPLHNILVDGFLSMHGFIGALDSPIMICIVLKLLHD
jgi:hypothetical protein